jgi:hypothetical protein
MSISESLSHFIESVVGSSEAMILLKDLPDKIMSQPLVVAKKHSHLALAMSEFSSIAL